jgi:hypothetical protein
MEINNYVGETLSVGKSVTDYYVRKKYSLRRFNENLTTERSYFYPTVQEKTSSRELVPVKYSKPIYVDYPTIFGQLDPIVASYYQINRP